MRDYVARLMVDVTQMKSPPAMAPSDRVLEMPEAPAFIYLQTPDWQECLLTTRGCTNA